MLPEIEELLALAERGALVEAERLDGTSVHGELVDVRQGCLVLERADGGVQFMHLGSLAAVDEVRG